MSDRKTQSFASLPAIARGIVIIGLMTLLFVSCASNAPTASGKLNVTAHQHATSGGQKALNAPGSNDADAVETRLTELFGLCKNNDAERAASYFVYRGQDKAREWKDTLRAGDPVEKAAVEELCRRINGYTDKNQGYSFGEVKVERESEGEWHALEVTFYDGSETKKAIFAFLLIKGQFAIGDIDD